MHRYFQEQSRLKRVRHSRAGSYLDVTFDVDIVGALVDASQNSAAVLSAFQIDTHTHTNTNTSTHTHTRTATRARTPHIEKQVTTRELVASINSRC